MRDLVTDTAIPGLQLMARGRVRDLYALDDQLLTVATDRICVAGRRLSDGVPGQGCVINQLSAFWFDLLQNVAPSQFITADIVQIEELLRTYAVVVDTDLLRGRSMLVSRARPMPIRFILSAFLVGGSWREYSRLGEVAGQPLPPGLREGDPLPHPLLQPLPHNRDPGARVLEWEQMVHLVEPGHLNRMFDQARALYQSAAAYVLEKGIIIAEAEFRFALFQGMTILIGDCLTPDRARFWDADGFRAGRKPQEMGVQYLVDALGWTSNEHEAPSLSTEVLQRTGALYRNLFQRLTGTRLE